MKNIIEKIKNISKEDLTKVFICTMALIIILDCDIYLYPFFQSIHLPLPHTILTFIWLPLLILWVFYRLENNKKKVFIAALIIGLVYGGYFIVHHLSSHNLWPILKLTNNFYYDFYQELVYYLSMMMPLFFTSNHFLSLLYPPDGKGSGKNAGGGAGAADRRDEG